MKDRGFSLIEAIVVLIIISISISIVIPSLSKVSKGIELRSWTQKISGILRYCRSQAVNEGQTFSIIFDLDDRIIKIKSLESEKSSVIYPKEIMIKHVNIKSESQTSDKPVIEFYPNGSSNGGNIIIENGVRKFKIQIHPITGIVKVFSEEV